jgi:hypothetical protein
MVHLLRTSSSMSKRAGWRREPKTIFGRCSFRISGETSDVLTEVLREFLQPLQTNSKVVHKFGYDRLLPNNFQFVLYQLSYHWTLCSLATKGVLKHPTKEVKTSKNKWRKISANGRKKWTDNMEKTNILDRLRIKRLDKINCLKYT